MVVNQTKKDKDNMQFIKNIIADEREDRKQEQALHFQSYDKLADAIDRLSNKFN